MRATCKPCKVRKEILDLLLMALLDLASDLLEEVVEGPDLDSVYEVYATVGDEDEPTIPEEDYEEELMLSTGVL